MARYDYRCSSCGLQFEVEHPMSEHPEVTCPECGSPASQVFNASGIVFKGSGFYNTDQRGKGSSGASTATTSQGQSSTESSASPNPSGKGEHKGGDKTAGSGSTASSSSSAK